MGKKTGYIFADTSDAENRLLQGAIDPISGTPDYYDRNPNIKREPVTQNAMEISTLTQRAFPETENFGQIFDPYGGMRNIDKKLSYEDLRDIPESRAEAQSGAGLIGKFFGNLITEAVLGSVEGIGYALDFEEFYNADKQAEEGFDSWLSKGTRELKESIQNNLFPVYQSRDAQEGSFGDRLSDATWWASQGKTFGTTLSLLLPSMGVMGAVGKAGKGLRGMKYGEEILQFAQGGAGALFSRKAESAMEANNTFQSQLDKYLQQGIRYSDAAIMAGQEAAAVYKANAAMLPVDFLQYSLLLKPFKALGASIEAMKATNMGKVGSAMFQMGSEAGEEAYQFVAQAEATRLGDGVTPFGEGFGSRLENYMTDPEFQTSAFMGGLMGGVFSAAGPIAQNVADVYGKFATQKAIAASFGNIEGFNKVDNKVEGMLIARALQSDQLDRLSSEIETFGQTIADKGDLSEEDRLEIGKKIGRIKENIEYIKKADEILKESSPDIYAKNPRLRKNYALAKYEDKLNEEEISKYENEVNKASVLTSDPRDNAIKLNQNIKALEISRDRMLKDETLSVNERMNQAEKINAQISTTQEQLNAQVEAIKGDDRYKDFTLKNYTIAKSEEVFKARKKLVNALIARNIYRQNLAQYENLSKKEAEKKEQELNDTAVEKGKAAKRKQAENTMTNATNEEVIDIAATTSKEDFDEFVSDNLKNKADAEPPVDRGVPPADVTSQFEGDTGVIPQEEKLFTFTEVFDSKYKNSDNKFVLDKKNLTANITKYISDAVNKGSISIADAEALMGISKALLKSKNSFEADKYLMELYNSPMGKEISDIVKKFMSVKQAEEPKKVTKEISQEPVISNTVIEEEEISPVRLFADGFPAIWQEFAIDPGTRKINYNLPDSGIEDPDFNWDYIDNPDNVNFPTVTFEVNLNTKYNKGVLDAFAGKRDLSFYDAVSIMVVHYDTNGKRHVLSILSSSSLTNKLAGKNLANQLYLLRKEIIDGALASDHTQTYKSGMEATAEKTEGLIHNTKEKHPITKVKRLPKIKGEKRLIVGIVRYNKEEGIYIDSPNAGPEFHRVNVNRQPGSAVLWVEGGNGKLIPVRAFTKNFKTLRTDNKKLYENSLKDIRRIVTEITPENIKEKIKELQSYFYTPFMINTNKDGTIRSISFVKNFMADDIAALSELVKSNTEEAQNLIAGYVERYNITEQELKELASGKAIRLGRTGTQNVVFELDFTSKDTKNPKSVFSKEFELFLDDLVHQVDVDKVNKVTADEFGKVKSYNRDVLKDILYVNVNPDKPTHSHSFKINPDVRKKESIEVKKEEVPTLPVNPIIPNTILTGNEPVVSPSDIENTKGVDVTENPESIASEDDFNEFISQNTVKEEVSSKPTESEFQNALKSLTNLLIKKDPSAKEVKENYLDYMYQEPEKWFLPQDVAKGKELAQRALLYIGYRNVRPSLVTEENLNGLMWNEKTERDWMNNNLPIDNETLRLDITDTLINIGDKTAWGVFRDNMITIFRNAIAGIGFHEAFHSVFNMALSENEQKLILSEAEKRYNSTDVDYLEEKLANEFAEYIKSFEYTTTITGKIRNFFRKLFGFFKYNLFSSNEIDKLFYNINTGKFKNRKFTNVKGVTRASIEGLTDIQRRVRVDNIAFRMSVVTDELNSLEENKNKTRFQIIKEYGLTRIAEIAYDKLLQDYLSKRASANEYKNTQMSTTLRAFFELERNANGKLQRGQIGILGKESQVQFAKNEGINIKVKGLSINGIDPLTDEEVIQLDENINKSEHWMIDVLSQARRDNVGTEVKSILARIPMTDRFGNPLLDDIDEPRYLDYNESFATLVRELADNNRPSEMIENLKEFAEMKPGYTALLNKILSDKSFKTKFWRAMQNSHADYKLLLEQSFEEDNNKPVGERRRKFSWMSSGRQAITNSILDNWRESFTSADTNELVRLKSELSEDKFKEESAKRVEAIRNDFGKNANISPEKLYEYLNKYGFDITLDELLIMKDISTSDGKSTVFQQVAYKLYAPLVSLASGIDPFSDKEKTAVNNLKIAARMVGRNRPDYMESSFKTVEKKTVYSHILMGFLPRMINEIKNNPQFVEALSSELGYQYLPWLTDFRNEDERAELEYAILDGLKFASEEKGTSYDKMSPKMLNITRLNAFYNNAKPGYAYYMVPVLSDNPTAMFIQAKELNEADAVKSVVRILRSEWEIVKNSDSAKGIKNLQDRSKGFVIMESLDTPKVRELLTKLDRAIEINDEAELRTLGVAFREIARTYLDSEVKKSLEEFENQKIIIRDKDGKITSKLLDDRITQGEGTKTYTNIEQFVRSYVYNYVPAKAQMLMLFAGNPGTYKNTDNNTEDLYKRLKEIWAPGLRLDTDAEFELNKEQAEKEGTSSVKVNPVYRGVYLHDVEEESINGLFKGKKHNLTDGQSFIRPERYREVRIGKGEWDTQTHDDFNNVIEGKPATGVYNPFKPFVFGHRNINGLRVPYQHKNSETMLTPMLALWHTNPETGEMSVKFPTVMDRKSGYKDYESPILAKMLDFMERYSYGDTNYVDVIHFNSVVKVGEYGTGTVDDIENTLIQEFDNEDYILMQETPDHFTDDAGNFGTQIRKLIIADLGDGTYTISGTDKIFTKDEITELYQDLITEDVRESFDKIQKLFPNPNDDLDKYNEAILSLSTRLIKEAIERNLGDEARYSLGTYMDPIDGKVKFNIPLYDPIHASRSEHLLGSLFKNNVIKQKINGGNLVMVSSVGLSDKIGIKMKEDGSVEYIECYAPWWSEKYLKPLMDVNGNVDISKITDKRILDMIGYRIPTEDKYSMLPLRIVKFLPRSQGGIIILPREITTLTGADFDIDKLYVMIPNFYTSRKWDFEKLAEELRLQGYAVTAGSLGGIFKKINAGEELTDRDIEIYDTVNLLPDVVIDRISKDPTIHKIEYDYNKSPQEQSKKARDNAKIDIMWSILTNKMTADKLLNPGGFAYVSAIAEEIKNKKGWNSKMDILSPSTDITMFEAASAASALIGVFANQNVNHAIFQHGDIKLTEPIRFAGQFFDTLSGLNTSEKDNPVDSFKKVSEKHEDPKRISRKLAMMLSAIVDDIKHLNSGPLNISFFTADVLSTAMRLGFSLKSSLALINQPAVIDLANTYRDLGGTFDKFDAALAITQHKYGDNGNLTSKDLTFETLWKSIGQNVDKMSEGEKWEQLAVLDLFKELRDRSIDIGKWIRAYRADDVTRKVTIASNRVFENNLNKAMKVKSFTGYNELWESYKMMKEFYDKGVKESGNTLKQIFLYGNKAFEDVENEITDNLIGNKELTEEQIQFINFELMSALAGKFEFFNGDKLIPVENGFITEREQILKEFPLQLREFLKKYPDFLKYKILRNLNIKPATRYNKQLVIKHANTGTLTDADKSELSESWYSLFNYRDKNPVIEKSIEMIAKNLVKYAYYAYGFHIDPNSFSQYIPLQWRFNLKDENDVKYNTFLEKLFDESQISGKFAGLTRQFMQHNSTNRFFVPRMEFLEDKEKLQKETAAGRFVVVNDVPVELTLNQDYNKEFVINKATETSDVKFPRFVSVEYSKKIYLMEAIGTSKYTYTYKTIPTLGIKNYAKEYSPQLGRDNVKSSIFADNNVGEVKVSEKSKVEVKPTPTQQILPFATEAPKISADDIKKASTVSDTFGITRKDLIANFDAYSDLMKELGVSKEDISNISNDKLAEIIKKICK